MPNGSPINCIANGLVIDDFDVASVAGFDIHERADGVMFIEMESLGPGSHSEARQSGPVLDQ